MMRNGGVNAHRWFFFLLIFKVSDHGLNNVYPLILWPMLCSVVRIVVSLQMGGHTKEQKPPSIRFQEQPERVYHAASFQ